MSSWTQQALIEAPVEEVWRLLCDPESGRLGEDVIAVTGARQDREGLDLQLKSRPAESRHDDYKVEELDDLHDPMQCQVRFTH